MRYTIVANKDLSRIRPVKTRNKAEKRSLAGTRSAEKRNALACLQLKAGTIEDVAVITATPRAWNAEANVFQFKIKDL